MPDESGYMSRVGEPPTREVRVRLWWPSPRRRTMTMKGSIETTRKGDGGENPSTSGGVRVRDRVRRVRKR